MARTKVAIPSTIHSPTTNVMLIILASFAVLRGMWWTKRHPCNVKYLARALGNLTQSAGRTLSQNQLNAFRRHLGNVTLEGAMFLEVLPGLREFSRVPGAHVAIGTLLSGSLREIRVRQGGLRHGE